MIEYEEEWLLPLLWKREGSVAFRAAIFAVPSATLATILVYLDEWRPGLREDLGFPDLTGSQIWSASTGVCMLLIAFRTSTALSRFWEGTGLLHQMRGEWFDTVSNCITFSISAKVKHPKEVRIFRHSLVRLMSLCHGSALEEIAMNQIAVDIIDIAGLDFQTLAHLKECDQVHGFNKVEVMLHLVQSLITKAHDDSILNIPAPILSRVYQTISRGFVNLLNAKKIVDTKFPFPYAQMIASLLLFSTVLTPMMLGYAIKSKILASLFTFIPIFGMYSLNFIALELEDPFGTDANDLPLSNFQFEMNNCLLMLLHDNTDMIAGTSERCIKDFDLLLEAWDKDPDDPESAKRRLSAYDMTRLARIAAGEDVDADSPYRKAKAAEGDAEEEEEYISPLASHKVADAISPRSPQAPLPPKESPSPPPTPLTFPPPLEPLVPPVVPTPLAVELTTPRPPPSPEEMRRLKEEEAIRLEAAQREVEKRMNEFYLALQRWTLMIESQVKQIHEMLGVLRALSESAAQIEDGGWEHAIHPL